MARLTHQGVIKHVVSVSGGKDSTATLLIALGRFGRGRVTPIFCDTGNEHSLVHKHLEYLEKALDIEIVRLQANFDAEIATKRQFVARDQRTGRDYDTALVFDGDGNPVPRRDGRGNIVTKKAKRNGVEVLEPVQKTRKVGGGHRIRWRTRPNGGRCLHSTRPATRFWIYACGKGDSPQGRRNSAPKSSSATSPLRTNLI